MNCAGKVALVTGASGSGLGRSIALTLAREGAEVVVNYRSSDAEAQRVVEVIESRGGKAWAVQADIASGDDCRQLVNTVMAKTGRIDICVIGPGGGWHPEGLTELDPEQALEDLRQEAEPVLRLMRFVLPGMYERGWGRLIGLGSHPTKPSPAYAYNLGKAARKEAILLAEDQAWAHGVTVNVIAPGPVDGIPTLESAVEQSEHGDAWTQRVNVTPQDIAEGVSFLCSEAGRFVTGCVLLYWFRG